MPDWWEVRAIHGRKKVAAMAAERVKGVIRVVGEVASVRVCVRKFPSCVIALRTLDNPLYVLQVVPAISGLSLSSVQEDAQRDNLLLHSRIPKCGRPESGSLEDFMLLIMNSSHPNSRNKGSPWIAITALTQ